MDRRTIIFGVAVLALIIIVWYFMFRKPEVKPTVTPEITFLESSYTIVPDNVETYVIENYTDVELSGYVEVTIKWKNYHGFESVKKLKISRLVDGVVKEFFTSVKSTETDTDIKSWFEDFGDQKTHSYKFTNKDSSNNAYNALGKNTFKLEYNTKDDDTSWQEITAMNSVSFDLNADEIQMAINTSKIQTIVLTPNINLPPNSIEKTFTNEPIYFYTTYDGRSYSLNTLLIADQTTGFSLFLDGTDTTRKTYVLKKDGDDGILQTNLETFGGTSPLKFVILLNGTKIILGTYNAEGNIDQVVGLLPVGNTIKPSLIKYDSINNKNVFDSIKWEYSTSVRDINSLCEVEKVADYPCNTTISGIQHPNGPYQERGKSIKTYEITRLGYGINSRGDNLKNICNVDGVNILGPASPEFKVDVDNKYHIYKSCEAPTVWANKNLNERQSACKNQKGFGDCINNIEATSPSMNLTTEQAFTKYPAVNTPESTTEPPPVSCIDVLGRCTSFCPTPQRTFVTGTCTYDSGGSDTKGRGTFTYPSKNGPDCNHVTVPPNEFSPTSECPPECHRPNYVASFLGCWGDESETDAGAEYIIEDAKGVDYKPSLGQGICSGVDTRVVDQRIYAKNIDNSKNPCTTKWVYDQIQYENVNKYVPKSPWSGPNSLPTNTINGVASIIW